MSLTTLTAPNVTTTLIDGSEAPALVVHLHRGRLSYWTLDGQFRDVEPYLYVRGYPDDPDAWFRVEEVLGGGDCNVSDEDSEYRVTLTGWTVRA